MSRTSWWKGGFEALWMTLVIGATCVFAGYMLYDCAKTDYACAYGREFEDRDLVDVHDVHHHGSEFVCLACKDGHEDVCMACKHWKYDGWDWHCATSR